MAYPLNTTLAVLLKSNTLSAFDAYPSFRVNISFDFPILNPLLVRKNTKQERT